jgi:hypothetical protein
MDTDRRDPNRPNFDPPTPAFEFFRYLLTSSLARYCPRMLRWEV